MEDEMKLDDNGYARYTAWENLKAFGVKYEGWLLVTAGVVTLVAILVITR